MSNAKMLEKKVVIVTGGGGNGTGIGTAIVKELAREGASVAVFDKSFSDDCFNDLLALQAETGSEVISVTCDITNRESVDTCVTYATRTLGPINFLVHAAVASIRKPFRNITGDEFRFTIDTIVMGGFNVLQAVYLHMLQYPDTDRRICVIGSPLATTGEALPFCGDYNTGKGGLKLLTHTLMTELIPDGILVYELEPGWTDTGSERAMCPNIDEVAKNFPGGLVTREQIAHTAAFLLSPGAEALCSTTVVVGKGHFNKPWRVLNDRPKAETVISIGETGDNGVPEMRETKIA